MDNIVDYIDFKNAIKIIFNVEEDMDETCDINISDNSKSCILSNDFIRKGYDSLAGFQSNGLEMYNDTYREIAVLERFSFGFIVESKQNWTNEHNQITYTINKPSVEYCFNIINQIAILISQHGYYQIAKTTSIHIRSTIQDNFLNGLGDDPVEIIRKPFWINTLTITSNQSISHETFRDLASSFCFYYMYYRSQSLKENYNLVELLEKKDEKDFWKENPGTERIECKRIDPSVLNYYSYANETRNPFIAYISYYHVLEYFYGQRDELESLKEVIQSYVDIEKLKIIITEINPNAVIYYKDNNVPFINNEQLKIPWSDIAGVNTVIAKRIYKTRNAIAHSKRDQSDKQYSPYTDAGSLMKELPLIRAVAELVIIISSEDIVV